MKKEPAAKADIEQLKAEVKTSQDTIRRIKAYDPPDIPAPELNRIISILVALENLEQHLTSDLRSVRKSLYCEIDKLNPLVSGGIRSSVSLHTSKRKQYIGKTVGYAKAIIVLFKTIFGFFQE